MSDLEAVKRERDEARALADSYANGEVITKGIARLVDEQCARAYAARDEARAALRVMESRIQEGSEFTVRRLTQMMEAGGTMLVADHEAALRDVAEKQREACAREVDRRVREDNADTGNANTRFGNEIRSTPLVTEVKRG